jgi:hypothetical protein
LLTLALAPTSAHAELPRVTFAKHINHASPGKKRNLPRFSANVHGPICIAELIPAVKRAVSLISPEHRQQASQKNAASPTLAALTFSTQKLPTAADKTFAARWWYS